MSAVDVRPPYIGWRPYHTATYRTRRPLLAEAWIPCPTCWGQRIIMEPIGGGWARCSCPTCMGIGEIVRLLDVDR